MITKDEAVSAALSFASVYEDYPFEQGNWAAIRHKGNKKVFAFVLLRNGEVWLNVKHTAEDGLVWREIYESIVPAYHMNKVHWSSVILNGSIDDKVIMKLLSDSYDLTKPQARVRKN